MTTNRWLPTEENLAVLPAGVKQYIHALETNADPAGTVRQNVLLRDEVAQLRALVEADHQDAERYRWLRDKHDDIEPNHFWHVRDHNAHPIARRQLDATIDAAMGSEQVGAK